ncbi:adenosine receptor A2b-like [Phyllobates terribilis]|uniref:adenosine receptor A2b-like n=1 Tax=Phyllobates terribilis TaxID=111132 RepID=UPI003CCAE89C
MDSSSAFLLSTNQIVYFTVYAILASVIVTFNLSVLIPIIAKKSLRNENRFLYMLSTCSSDLCTGFSCFYIGSKGDALDMHSSPADTRYIVPTFLGLSYLVTLAAQADRYHAVSSPYKYLRRMTVMRTVFLILGLWVYAFLIVAINNLVTSNVAIKVTSAGTFFCYFFTMVIMIGLNIKLFMIAKYQIERDPATSEKEAKRASLYLIIVVSGFFLVTWFPTILHISLCDFIAVPCQPMEKKGTAVLKFLPRMNAAITPMLYVYGCKPLRQKLRKVWKTVCQCNRSFSISQQRTQRTAVQPLADVVIINTVDK